MSLHHYTNDATSFYIRLSVLDTQPHRNTEELEKIQSRKTITSMGWFLDKEWLHKSGVFKLEKDTTDIYMTVNDKEKIYKRWFIISPIEAQDSNTVMKQWIKN